jgi:hypothetical protein
MAQITFNSLTECRSSSLSLERTVPEILDPVFAKTSQKRSFWACFRENCVFKFGHCLFEDIESVTCVMNKLAGSGRWQALVGGQVPYWVAGFMNG